MKSFVIFVCFVIAATCSSIPRGAKPVQLLQLGEEGQIHFNNETIKDLFQDPKLVDRQVVVFSIIGDYRKGKSFLLNYILRYMYAHYKSLLNDELINSHNWLGDKDSRLTGFPWGAGVKRVTTGLILWSDVFLYEDKGEKFAIYIMDTQGLFDHRTTSAENAKIFSLSTMISSMQILNVLNIINENQLEYLQFATSYATYALSTQDKAPFQKLMFLIRDWNSPNDNPYGIEGGKDYLDDILKIRDQQKEPLKEVRKYLKSSFDELECFLMPHPGKIVARQSSYIGSWREIDDDFVVGMKDLFKFMFSPSKLTPKKINGQAIKPRDLLIFIRTYVENFKNHIPKTTSIIEATIDQQFSILISKSVDIYIESVGHSKVEVKSEDDVKKLHDSAIENALKFFDLQKKFGSHHNGVQYKRQLIEKIEHAYASWKKTTMDQMAKMNVLERETDNQLVQVEEAQARDVTAKENLHQVEKKTDDARIALEKARNDTAEARVESEKLLKQFAAAQVERADALKREKETNDLLEKMRAETEAIQRQYNALRLSASSNVAQSLGAVQEQSGYASVFGGVAALATAITPMMGLILGNRMPLTAAIPAAPPMAAVTVPPAATPAAIPAAPPMAAVTAPPAATIVAPPAATTTASPAATTTASPAATTTASAVTTSAAPPVVPATNPVTVPASVPIASSTIAPLVLPSRQNLVRGQELVNRMMDKT